MLSKKLSLLVIVTGIVAMRSSYAAEPGRIALGGFDLLPTADLTLAYDDNVARSSGNETDSWLTRVEPAFVLLNEYEGNRFQLGYQLSRGEYFSTQQDDFTDHSLSAGIDYTLNSRHWVFVTALYADGHDDRGTAYSIGRGDALQGVDTFKRSDLEATYRYGAQSAAAGFEFNVHYRDLDYDREEAVYLQRDRELTTVTASFLYRIAPRTELVLDISQRSVDYAVSAEPDNSLDSDERRVLAGVRWESSAATSGYAKVGYQEKDFTSASRASFSGLDWEVGVEWQPVDHSQFDFSTYRDTNETNGEGNFIETKAYQVGWRYEWLERLSTRVALDVSKDSYERETSVREDDITRMTLTAAYQFRRWLTVDASYLLDNRDSNRDSVEYDRNLFSLTLRVTL